MHRNLAAYVEPVDVNPAAFYVNAENESISIAVRSRGKKTAQYIRMERGKFTEFLTLLNSEYAHHLNRLGVIPSAG